MHENEPTRRGFLATAGAVLASGAVFPQPSTLQSGEVKSYMWEVPPKATFWAIATFLGDDFIELSIATRTESKELRGRFDGQRLAEYAWKNRSSETQRVAIRAKAVATGRDLPPMLERWISKEGLYIGFGQRATPADLADRRGAYPYEAVLVAFILFGE